MENSQTHPEYEQTFKHIATVPDVMAEAQAEQAQAQAQQVQIQNRLMLTVEQLAISPGGVRAEVSDIG